MGGGGSIDKEQMSSTTGMECTANSRNGSG